MSSSIPLAFSRRTVAATAVFDCIGIAAPMTGAPLLTSNGVTIGKLALAYAQLTAVYPVLIRQDVANQKAVLDTAIVQAVTIVTSLNTTVQAMTATGDAGLTLRNMQIITFNALAALQAAQASGGD